MSLLDLAPSNITPSPDVVYIRGGFAFEHSSVPFFAATLQAGVLNGLLRLPSQIPIDPDNPLELGELFQRELDVKRVEGNIVPYLRAANQLRFFNALTVVLLPARPDNNRQIAREYPQDDRAPAAQADLERTPIGPIALSHPDGNARYGHLAWNLNETVPVVLDGQHRFRAMQIILNDTAGRLREDLARAEVSVLFLILDHRAGFEAPAGTTVLGACRQIFIDINKHARIVPRTRLFLLDDRDIVSVSMRAVLASSVKPQDKTIDARIKADGRLPLGLVDWRGTTAKFERTPYVTSLLTLHDIVDHIASVPTFDPLDYQRARQAIDKLRARFDLADDPGFPNQALLDEVDRAEAEERPFEFSTDQAKVAANAFFTRFAPRIVKPLTQLAPYTALINSLESAGIFGTGLEPWLSFNEDEKRALVNELNIDDPTVDVERAWTPVKERYPLAFQVVFQKASLYALNSLLNSPAATEEYLWPTGLPAGQQLLDGLIERYNIAVAPALGISGTDSPFLGAGVRADGTVDFRKTRISAITGFVVYLLLAPMEEWVKKKKSEVPKLTYGWVEDGWSQIAPGPRDPLSGLFSIHGKNWRNSVDDVVLVEDDEFFDDSRVKGRLDHAAEQLARATRAARA